MVSSSDNFGQKSWWKNKHLKWCQRGRYQPPYLLPLLRFILSLKLTSYLGTEKQGVKGMLLAYIWEGASIPNGGSRGHPINLVHKHRCTAVTTTTPILTWGGLQRRSGHNPRATQTPAQGTSLGPFAMWVWGNVRKTKFSSASNSFGPKSKRAKTTAGQ